MLKRSITGPRCGRRWTFSGLLIVAVECLVNVVLEGLLGVPIRKGSTEIESKVIHHQGFAEEIEGTRP